MIVQSQPSPDAIVFKGRSDFLKTIRARVDRRLVGRSPFGDGRLYGKALIIGLWFVASYALLLTIRVGWEQLLACISFGLAACALGFNVFHDANHGSFSPSRRVNLAVSASGNARKMAAYTPLHIQNSSFCPRDMVGVR